MEGANTLIPVDNPRDNKNNKEVSVLVLPSNLDSKYSYAVYTFNLLKMGTKKTQITTIAIGIPKLILNKPHSIRISLAGCRKKSDSAGLCPHDT